MKRRIYRLKWNKTTSVWVLWVRGHAIFVNTIKARAERKARWIVRGDAPSQLLIYTKRGTIGKGGRYEASYGCDSKRRKG